MYIGVGDLVKQTILIKSSVVFELFAACYLVVNFEQLKPKDSILTRSSQINFENFVKEARIKLSNECWNDLNVFFNFESYIGMGLLPYLIEKNSYEQFPNFLKDLEQLDESVMMQLFLKTGYLPELFLNNIGDPYEVLQYLKNTAFPIDEQWKLFYLIFDAAQTKQNFIKMINEFYSVVFNSWLSTTSILDFHLKSIDQWDSFLTLSVDKLERILGITIEQKLINNHMIYLFPSIFMNSNSMMFLGQNSIVYLFGINRFDVVNERITEPREIWEALKILSDDKRVRIIQILNQAPRYGFELAKELDLTNSTISHHINALINFEFLTAIKQENKIYYKVNKQNIKTVLEQIIKALT